MPTAAAALSNEFDQDFYAPYEAAARAALEVLCAARKRHESDVLAIHYRLKTPASIRGKLQKKGLPPSAQAAVACLSDVAGLRAVLTDTKAVYRFADTLIKSGAFQLLFIHDYIAMPKKSGYQSLHLILRVPVRVRGQMMMAPAEIQLRTKAMDAWASVEHRLIYKPIQKTL